MMKIKTGFRILLIMLISGISSAYADDHCKFSGFTGVCYFDTFDRNPKAVVDFYCDTEGAGSVHMYNHNVLVGGFITGSDVGAGSFSFFGPSTKKFLEQHYFAVKSDPERSGIRTVVVLAAGPIHCHIGKGNRSTPLPGLFGHES